MRGWMVRLVVALVLALAGPAVAHAAGRVALVVGIGNYAYVEKLPNPPKDAALIASALRAADFDVTVLQPGDLTRANLIRALQAFRAKATGAEAAVIYFAGHGVEVGGINWLLPADAMADRPDDLENSAVRARYLATVLGGASKVRLLILDACRNNPFKALGGWLGEQRGIGDRGLARDPSVDDSVVQLLAAQPGETASDGKGAANSPFASALAQTLARRGLRVSALPSRLKEAMQASGQVTQTPDQQGIWADPDWQFLADAAAGSIAAVRPGVASDPMAEDARDWAEAFRANSRAAFAAYLARRPTGLFAGEAQRRIAAFDQPAPQVVGGPSQAQRNQTLQQDSYARWGLTESDFRLLDARPLLAKAGGAARFAEWEKAAADGDAVALTLTGMGHDWGVGAKQDSVEALRWYRKAAELGQPQASRYIAFIYRNGDGVPVDRAEGLRWYRRGAELGDPVAMNDVGLAYGTGAGVARDYDEAVRWYRKAADLGYALAMKNLGYMYDAGHGVPQDYAEAMRWYRKAADLGHALAMTNIGYMYEKGNGVPQDYAEAMRWYRKAADLGHALAMTNIGYMYEKGKSVPQDYAEAVRWYRKAADLGDSLGIKNLGYMYDAGHGVPQDYAEAMRWYRKAADLGQAGAMTNIGYMYEKGRGVPQDYAEAMRWYRKAADLGDSLGINNLGYMYDAGHGVPQDYAEAMRWYRKAAELGDAAAMTNIGALYKTGQGVARNYAEAARWYRKAADLDEPVAMANIAWFYYNGIGVAQNFAEARRWWEKAAALGDFSARAALDQLKAEGH